MANTSSYSIGFILAFIVIFSWLIDCHALSYHQNSTFRRAVDGRRNERYARDAAARRRQIRSAGGGVNSDWDPAVHDPEMGDKNAGELHQTEDARKQVMFETSQVLDTLLQDYDNRLRPSFGGNIYRLPPPPHPTPSLWNIKHLQLTRLHL